MQVVAKMFFPNLGISWKADNITFNLAILRQQWL